MKHAISILLLAACIAAAGCSSATYTPPPTYPVKSSAECAMSYDDVWSAVIRTLAIKGHQIKSQDKENGVIVTEDAFLADPGTYCDCGNIKNRENLKYAVRNVTNSSNIVLTRLSDSMTSVYIITTFLASLDYTGDSYQSIIKCSSRGVFENELLDQLTKMK